MLRGWKYGFRLLLSTASHRQTKEMASVSHWCWRRSTNRLESIFLFSVDLGHLNNRNEQNRKENSRHSIDIRHSKHFDLVRFSQLSPSFQHSIATVSQVDDRLVRLSEHRKAFTFLAINARIIKKTEWCRTNGGGTKPRGILSMLPSLCFMSHFSQFPFFGCGSIRSALGQNMIITKHQMFIWCWRRSRAMKGTAETTWRSLPREGPQSKDKENDEMLTRH